VGGFLVMSVEKFGMLQMEGRHFNRIDKVW